MQSRYDDFLSRGKYFAKIECVFAFVKDASVGWDKIITANKHHHLL